jgi:hypothetical protein
VFKNRILRKIFGPNRVEVRGDCRELRSWGLHGLYSLPDIWTMKSRKMRWVIHVECMKRRHVYRVFVGKQMKLIAWRTWVYMGG